MDTIIVIVLLVVSLLYNMKQYKELNSSKKPQKKSAYKKSWENGGKAKKTWNDDK
jgi:hypothetical protein